MLTFCSSVKVFYFRITKQQVLFVTELLHGCSKYLKNLDRLTLVTSTLKGLLAEFQRLLQTKQTGRFNNTTCKTGQWKLLFLCIGKYQVKGELWFLAVLL